MLIKKLINTGLRRNFHSGQTKLCFAAMQALCLAGVAFSSAAADIVNDTWRDGNRNTPASPTYSENGVDSDADGNIESAWFNSGSTTTPMTVVDDATPGGNQLLRAAVTPTGAVSWVTYFTPEASPVTLANVGDQMKITWVFTPTGLNSASTAQGLRIAIVDSPSASRISTESSPGSSTYAGYALFGNMRSGNLGNGNSFAIMERTDKTTASALLSASASWTSRANGATTTTPGYTEGVPYTLVMTFTRAAGNSLDIAATMTGSGLGTNGAGLSVSYSDATPDTFTFDTFNIRPQTGNDTATNFDSSLFRVEFIPACVTAGINSDPTNKTVGLGQTATFTVNAAGASPTYQWQFSTDSGGSWNNVTNGIGGTAASYTTAATLASDSGRQYRAIVNVACDSSTVTSAAATLTVTLPRNLVWVGDSVANLWDTTTANWTGEANVFQPNDNVTFNDSGSASPAIDLVGVISPANITVAGSQNYTIGSTSGGSLGGGASLTKSGNGKLTLTTVNTYTGKATVSGGTLSVATGANLGTAPGSFVADQLTLNGGALEVTASGSINANRGVTLGASGGTISVPSGVNFTNSPIITGSGSLAKVDTGALFLNVANTYTGGTVISNGTLSVGNGNALGGGTLTIAGGAVTFPAATTITNSVNVVGDSSITFSNTGSSAVIFNGLGFSGTAGRTLTMNPPSGSTTGARIRLNAGMTNNITFNANLVLNGVFMFATYNNQGDETFTGTISGAGTLGRRSTLAGVAGNTILSGNNTFSGGTVISDGGIGFASSSVGSPVTSGPVGTGSITLESNPGTGKQLFAVGAPRTVGNNIVFPASNTNQVFTLGGSQALTLSGSVDLGGTNWTIDVVNTADSTLSGAINNGGFVKTGTGTLVLDGAATVSSGVVISNGVLAGIGSITGALTVQQNGTLSPGGSGIGAFAVNGDLSLNGNTAITVNRQAGTKDTVTGIGTLNYGGTLTVVNQSGTLQAGDSFAIFSATTPVGNFVNISGSPGAGLNWQFNPATGILSVVSSTVQPPTLNVAQSGNSLTFSWTGAFKLQSQTNGLSTGLSTNWSDYPNGSSSPVNITINPANPAVFYRLINQ